MHRDFIHRYSTLALAVVLASTAAMTDTYAEVNRLTRSEQLSGWELLFDGSSTDGWRGYRAKTVSDGWKVEDGELIRFGKKAGDIITEKQYKYFELSLEYKISEAGNSGVMFHVTEDNEKPWHSGPEIQVQDNSAGHDPQKAGWLYQLHQPKPPSWVGDLEAGDGPLDATRPVGNWNQIYLRISPRGCLVTMNGQLYYNFNLGSKDWEKRVAKSKFAKFPQFGKAGSGHICLQDHNDLVSFRNIKVRELADDGSAPSPIDGTLAMDKELAFPSLKWEGWEPIDEDGNVVKKGLRILELTYAKGDPQKRLFAAAQRGKIYTFENRQDAKMAKVFLDIEEKVSLFLGGGGNEQGLLGLALHPNFTENGEFFVCYTRAENDQSVVARYRVSKEDGNKADADSEEVLLEVDQPFKNHNGGSIEFGPDGYLYVGFGDGGLRNDPTASGQDMSRLLGSIIRIDVDNKSGDLPYGIPGDNPFVDTAGARPEIYAIGFRNPWRIAFDSASGRLWAGEVGQELWEEINVVEKGGNYGWSDREASHPFGNRPEVEGVPEAIDPVWEYDHIAGKSVTGGRVYNGSRLAGLRGKYLYADYVTGTVWGITYDPSSGKVTRNDQLIEKGIPILAFGEDEAGEVYFTIENIKGEGIYRFVEK